MRLNAINLKEFTVILIEKRISIVHGGPGYSFLNDDDSVWDHEAHNHDHGDFGWVSQYSHIENTWNGVVQEITNIYGHIPSKNYIYFILEGEFRLNFFKKSDQKKLDIFYKILKQIYALNESEFSSIEEIMGFDNYNY